MLHQYLQNFFILDLRICRQTRNEQGTTLVEIIFATFLSLVIAMGILSSTLTSYQTAGGNSRNSVATQLALEKLEQFAAITPQNISSANNQTENDLLRDHMSFIRTVTVTTSSDRTRIVTVNVRAKNSRFQTNITLSNSFALWGER